MPCHPIGLESKLMTQPAIWSNAADREFNERARHKRRTIRRIKGSVISGSGSYFEHPDLGVGGKERSRREKWQNNLHTVDRSKNENHLSEFQAWVWIAGEGSRD